MTFLYVASLWTRCRTSTSCTRKEMSGLLAKGPLVTCRSFEVPAEYRPEGGSVVLGSFVLSVWPSTATGWHSHSRSASSRSSRACTASCRAAPTTRGVFCDLFLGLWSDHFCDALDACLTSALSFFYFNLAGVCVTYH